MGRKTKSALLEIKNRKETLYGALSCPFFAFGLCDHLSICLCKKMERILKDFTQRDTCYSHKRNKKNLLMSGFNVLIRLLEAMSKG